MPKKVNIKKFLSNITENQILEALFKMSSNEKSKITGIPEIHENMNKKDKAKVIYEFYKNLDPEYRLELEDNISLIGVLDNKHAQKIIKSKYSKTDVVEGRKESTLNTPLIILSKTYTDLAIAFYIEHFEKVEEVKNITNFYLKSGYKRYEANDKLFKDIGTKMDQLSEKFTELLSENENTTHVEVSTYEYDKKYFTTIKYDKNTKEILFVFIPELKELLMRASGNFERLFSFAENYLRIMNGFSINPKELEFDLSYFINIFDKEKKIAEQSLTTPLMPHADTKSWQMLSINLERNATKQKINLTFPASKEAVGKSGFAEMMDIFREENIKLYEVTKLRIKADVTDTSVKKGHSTTSITLEKNKANLNLLKPEHVSLSKILLDNKVCLGWKDWKGMPNF